MEQDGRFSNKDKKLLKQLTFPPEFSQKVDMKKVITFFQWSWLCWRRLHL